LIRLKTAENLDFSRMFRADFDFVPLIGSGRLLDKQAMTIARQKNSLGWNLQCQRFVGFAIQRSLTSPLSGDVGVINPAPYFDVREAGSRKSATTSSLPVKVWSG